MANLGGTLLTRYERTGNKADLDEAIEIARAALAAAPPEHPFRGGILSILGLALRVRYDRIGALADLDEAVEVSRAAVDAAPPGHPDRAGELANFGIALVTRFERIGIAADLDKAVEVSRAAVDAAPLDHPDRARHLSSLAGILQPGSRTGSNVLGWQPTWTRRSRSAGPRWTPPQSITRTAPSGSPTSG